MMSSRLLRSLILVVFALSAGGCTPDDSPERPNVVFILADDMGYGDLRSFNDDSQIPTPHLNRLAADGMRFTDAHASGSLCVPSRYGLLTGRNPHREDMTDWRERSLIDADQSTLATVLRERGYTTYMVGKWHLGFEDGTDYDCSEPLRGGPRDRGFDHYFGLPASLDIPPYFYIRDRQCVAAPTDSIGPNYSDAEIWTDIQGAFWRGGGVASNFRHDEVLPRLKEETVSYLETHDEERSQRPFFMYMALTAPHTPWLPPDSLRGTTDAGLYGDFTAQVDGVVGHVLNALERNGLRENTIVVFSSDNGPVWYPKDVERFDHRSTDRYRGMKGDAWEGGHRVPFIVRWPGNVPAGTSSDQLLAFTDVLPTVADLTGSALPEDSTDGANLSAVWTAQRDSVSRGSVVHDALSYLVVRDGPWKLIPGLGSGGFTEPRTRTPASGEPQGQLYHLGKDPGETNNLYESRPDVVDRLQKELERYRSQRPQEAGSE